jgi:MFS transporter, MHS family, proline/betaine transporter
MMHGKETLSSLSKEKKEAIGLLSIGTFLEYFDLLLYVHMAVLLNELFFPKTDPHTAGLLSAFAFCSSYILRPLGALIFGYLGDNIGRKSTVIITTTMMSLSCFTMANLPTYEQIGITAAYIVTVCRIVQGMATMGEVIGADLYITELTKPPIQYPAVTLIAVFGVLGGTVALGVASLVTSFGLNWRSAFWLGTLVAVIGAVARTRLRETPDFADAKRRIKKAIIKAKHNPELLNQSTIWNEKVNKKTALSLFFIECSWPVCFYFSYMYCGNMLKTVFHFTPEAVIHQNFTVSMIQLFSWLIVAYLSYVIHPLKILRVRLMLFLCFVMLCPYMLNNVASPYHIMAIQAFIAVFGFMGTPAVPIFYKHLPVFKRFTYATFSYALSRAFVYVITSFGLVYLDVFFGNYVVLIVMIPTATAFIYALRHFEKLEKAGAHHAY